MPPLPEIIASMTAIERMPSSETCPPIDCRLSMSMNRPSEKAVANNTMATFMATRNVN